MIERVRQIIREDRRHTIDEVSMLVGISHGTCHKILTDDLKKRRLASKFVPRLLSVDQKQQRLDVCLDLKESAANDPIFLSNVITGDETWVYVYDPETKAQSSQWKSMGSPLPKHVELTGIINKPLLLHLVGCLYYLYCLIFF